jgi:hypothetical protein
MFFPVSERRTCMFQQVHNVKRGFLRRGSYRLLKYIKWGGESWPELLRGKSGRSNGSFVVIVKRVKLMLKEEVR